jgi:hypothetical protein
VAVPAPTAEQPSLNALRTFLADQLDACHACRTECRSLTDGVAIWTFRASMKVCSLVGGLNRDARGGCRPPGLRPQALGAASSITADHARFPFATAVTAFPGEETFR